MKPGFVNVSNSAGTEEESQKHMDQISEKGYLSEFHHGLMHKPIAAKDARKLLDARTAVDTEWKKLTHLPAWDSKKVKPKSEVVQQAKKDGRSVHVAIPMNFCHLKHSELAKHLHRYKGRCSRRDDVKDDSGTEQFSQNQELQLFKHQQKHILDTSA